MSMKAPIFTHIGHLLSCISEEVDIHIFEKVVDDIANKYYTVTVI